MLIDPPVRTDGFFKEIGYKLSREDI